MRRSGAERRRRPEADARRSRPEAASRLAARRAVLLLPLLLFLNAPSAWADGTPSCTEITNQASASFTIGESDYVRVSNTTVTTVAQLIDVSVVWQDAAAVVVRPGDTSRVLTFLVTNTGNGADGFSLEGASELAGDDFDPVLEAIYLDGDDDGVWDPDLDELYVPGSNDPSLDAGASIVVFLLSGIPADAAHGELAASELIATSNTGSGAPGTVILGVAPCGADAIVGTSGGRAADVGEYVVSTVEVSLLKSASIADPFGGVEPMPGAVITYSVVVTVEGTETAEDVTVVDAIPTNTTYVPGTLGLNGAALTDEADGDAGDVGATAPGAVTVALGDLAGGEAVQIVTFDVTID